MAKADLLARAQELDIPTTKEDGKELTVPELKEAISKKEGTEEVPGEEPETPSATPDELVEEVEFEETPKTPEATEKTEGPKEESESPEEIETDAEEVPAKKGKTARAKSFREKVADAVPALASFVNGNISEERAREILKDLVSE